MDLSTMLDTLSRVEDPETNKVIRWSVRDKFVLAALDEKDCPEPQALQATIKKAIESGVKNKINDLQDILER